MNPNLEFNMSLSEEIISQGIKFKFLDKESNVSFLEWSTRIKNKHQIEFSGQYFLC